MLIDLSLDVSGKMPAHDHLLSLDWWSIFFQSGGFEKHAMFHHQQQAVVNYLNGASNSNVSVDKTKQHHQVAPPGFPQFPPFNMRIRGEPQVFVSVAYDFEYLAEDGKRVFMKENEILLLINKTNHDWWQVSEYIFYCTVGKSILENENICKVIFVHKFK